jgi:hypothetical protein
MDLKSSCELHYYKNVFIESNRAITHKRECTNPSLQRTGKSFESNEQNRAGIYVYSFRRKKKLNGLTFLPAQAHKMESIAELVAQIPFHIMPFQ